MVFTDDSRTVSGYSLESFRDTNRCGKKNQSLCVPILSQDVRRIIPGSICHFGGIYMRISFGRQGDSRSLPKKGTDKYGSKLFALFL